MYRKLVCLISLVVLLGLSGKIEATTYYVSPSGNDNNSGTSPSQAWATIDRVNDVDLDAGDDVWFEGGQTFTVNEAAGEYLFFDAADSGTSANPVTIGSYGTGRATLSTGSTVGLYAKDCGGMVVQDLIFIGNDTGVDGDKGIAFWNSQPGLVDHVRIDNVRISTYRKGIELGGWTAGGVNSGYSDVRITNADIYDCGEMAIFIWGDEGNTSLANQDVYIGDCVIHDNLGVSGMSPHSGNGIIVSNTDGGTVEYCEAYNNGQYNDAGGGGPVGIWLYLCNNVVFQFCESHHNKTNGGDGGGFDIDGGATNCIVQYCYSHDNHGPGYQYAQYRGAGTFTNNTFRYNISEGDATASRVPQGAIQFWSSSSGVYDSKVYNNTVYVSSATRGAGIQSNSRQIYNTRIHNNIIQTVSGKQVINLNSSSGNWIFQGNCYWSGGDPIEVRWGKKTYNGLAAWRSGTGQETLDGQPVGFETDPKLTNPGGGGTVGDPHNLASLTAYELQSSSPIIDEGLNLQNLFGINPGSRDFYGTTIPVNSYYDIGADEYGMGQPDTTPPEPDPMTWATAPYATGDSSIAMEATTATDVSGVEYYFDCTSSGGHDSNWQDSTFYEDTGLGSGTQYCYQVKARDKSSNQNETAYSSNECATTNQPDTTPPSPDPMTWSVLPHATGSTSISMTATTATDQSGVEYFFDCTSSGGHDSGWQDSTSYTDTGLSPQTQYCYQVKARDKSTNQNETGFSTTQCATTEAGGETVLFSDDFESGDFVAGGWVTSGPDPSISGDAYQGNYCAQIKKTSWIERAVSTSGYTNIHIKYARICSRLDSGEYLYTEWYDGSNWHELEAITGDAPWAEKDMACGSGADNNASFKIRYRCNADTNPEWGKVDIVQVTGQN